MKKIIAFLMSLLICFMSVFVGNVANASELKLVARYTGYVNGVERILKITTDGTYNYLYVKSGEEDFQKNGILLPENQIFVGKNAIVWELDVELEILMYWCKEVSDPGVFSGYKHDVKRVITEGTGAETTAIAYETNDGKVYSLPGFYDLLNVDKSMPEPIYVPAYIPEPTTPNPVPNIAPISIKKTQTTTFLYEGKELISKYTLKKGVLTWQKGQKKRTYKNVSSYAIIEKSKNLIYVTNKGKVDRIAFKNGKKKTLAKKGGQKIICKKKYAVKIKIAGSGDIDVQNK